MARIAGIARSRTLVARLAFFLSRRSYGRVITPARVYALDSGLLLAVGLMEGVQEWAKQTSAPVKQLARMLVAWRICCPWCLDFGTKASEKLGVTEEQLRALPDYKHTSLFGEEERAVLRFADSMIRTPFQVPYLLIELPGRMGVPWLSALHPVNAPSDLLDSCDPGTVCFLAERERRGDGRRESSRHNARERIRLERMRRAWIACVDPV